MAEAESVRTFFLPLVRALPTRPRQRKCLKENKSRGVRRHHLYETSLRRATAAAAAPEGEVGNR